MPEHCTNSGAEEYSGNLLRLHSTSDQFDPSCQCVSLLQEDRNQDLVADLKEEDPVRHRARAKLCPAKRTARGAGLMNLPPARYTVE